MYNKQETKDVLLRLHREGRSIHVKDLDTRLYQSIRHHYGGIKNLKDDLGIVSKYPKKAETRRIWTTKKIIKELQPLLDKDLTAKDIMTRYPTLYGAITRQRCGGLQGFCKKYNLRQPRRECREKYTKKMVDDFIKNLPHEFDNYSSSYLRNTKYKGLVNASKRYYGTWNNALETNGVKPVTKIRRFDSAESVAKQFLKDHENGNTKNISYEKAIQKHFGNRRNLREYLGLNNTLYTKKQLDTKFFAIYDDSTVTDITNDILDERDSNITYSIRKHYGTLTAYINQLDIDFYEKRVPFYYTSKNIKRQLLLMIEKGQPVNYTEVAHSKTNFVKKAREYYGSYEGLFMACGLDYDKYRIDTGMASFYGRVFEDIVGDVLTELGFEYSKETDTELRPDFIIDDHWVDAKLSQWTIYLPNCDTIEKYEPHCSKLTIVFLRGDKTLDRKISKKTRIVNVTQLLKKLPKNRRFYFLEKVNEIEVRLNELEVGA